MIISFKRLIAALAFVLPAAALVVSPVMAATHTHAKTHHSIHKASSHKMHSRKATAQTTG